MTVFVFPAVCDGNKLQKANDHVQKTGCKDKLVGPLCSTMSQNTMARDTSLALSAIARCSGRSCPPAFSCNALELCDRLLHSMDQLRGLEVLVNPPRPKTHILSNRQELPGAPLALPLKRGAFTTGVFTRSSEVKTTQHGPFYRS